MLKTSRIVALFAMLVAVAAMCHCQAQVYLQTSPAALSSGKPSAQSHAERCVAAVDLGIMAAEGGVLDISVEAMERAAKKGPPVTSVDLGGILSSNPQTARYSSSSQQPSQNEQGEAKLASRLQRLNEVWTEKQIDPEVAYHAWKEAIFPSERPNEAFAYSTQTSNNSISYGRVAFEEAKPDLVPCGAKCLVQWAREAEQLEDLQATLDERRVLPGASEVVALIDVMLAADDSTSSERAEQVCERLAENPKKFLTGPNAEMMFGYAQQLVERLGDESPAVIELREGLFSTVRSTPRWPSNEWLKYMVAEALLSAVKSGDIERYKEASSLAMSQYDELSRGNAEYVKSCEAGMHAEAANRAFKAGNDELGVYCTGVFVQTPTTNNYGHGNLSDMLAPRSGILRGLAKTSPEKRLQLLGEVLEQSSILGVNRFDRLMPSFEVPALFAEAAGDPSVPRDRLAPEKAIALSLAEWYMREAIAADATEQVEQRIAELKSKKSDDAELAEVLWKVARGESAGLSAWQAEEAGEDGPKFQAWLGENARLVPMELEMLRLAGVDGRDPEGVEQVADRLLEIAMDKSQADYVVWLRALELQRQRARGEGPATDRALVHWLACNQLATDNLVRGRVPETVWVEKEPGKWGHLCGPNIAYLLLKYPLQGDFTFTFRWQDARWCEAGAMAGGMVADFEQHRKQVTLHGLGNRGAKGIATEVMKNNAENIGRIECRAGKLTVVVGEDQFEVEAGEFSAAYPFLGMYSLAVRDTTFWDLRLSGEYKVPREVDLISPTLIGWSGAFHNGANLVPLDLDGPRNSLRLADKEPKGLEWIYADGEIRTAPSDETEASQSSDNDETNAGRESVLHYLRPLAAGEKLSLEFFYEPGKHTVAPCLGRVAMLLDEPEVALHWITADDSQWTGVNNRNRVLDEQAEQLAPVELEPGEWNRLELSMEGDVVTLSINEQAVYRRAWEVDLDRKIGLFAYPNQHDVRVRGVKLSGDWPEKVPNDFFQKREMDTL